VDRVALNLVTAQLEERTAVLPSAPEIEAIAEPSWFWFPSLVMKVFSSLCCPPHFPFLSFAFTRQALRQQLSQNVRP